MGPSTSRAIVPQLVMPLAAYAAMAVFAAAQADPAAAAEGRSLALLAVAVLLPAAALAAREHLATAIATTLVVTAFWAIPAGPLRGATLGVLLAGTLAVAALLELRRRPGELTWTAAVALALGAQVLFRSGRLLDPAAVGAAALVDLLGLPLAAAAGAVVLARRHGVARALWAAAAVALLGPGWAPAGVLALLAVALGALMAPPASSGPGHRRSRPPISKVTRAEGPAPEATRNGNPEPLPRDVEESASTLRGPLLWVACGLLAGAAVVLDPMLAPVLLVALAVCLAPNTWRAQSLVLLAAALLLILGPAVRPWTESLTRLAWLPLLLPALPLAGRALLPRIVPTAALGLAAAHSLESAAGLAGPAVLLTLLLPREGAAARLQTAWSVALAAGAAVLATYPWLRARPLDAMLGLLGLDLDWTSALVAMGVLAALALVFDRLPPRRGWSPRAGYAGVAALALAAAAALPPAAVVTMNDPPATLNAKTRVWQQNLEEPAEIGSLAIDTYLDNSAGLEAGTRVAVVRLVGEDGKAWRWILRAGRETGEWAALRPDVAALPGFAAPPAWLTWITAGGVPAQRYRAVRELPEPMRVVRVEVRRIPRLPKPVRLAVFHLELRAPERRDR